MRPSLKQNKKLKGKQKRIATQTTKGMDFNNIKQSEGRHSQFIKYQMASFMLNVQSRWEREEIRRNGEGLLNGSDESILKHIVRVVPREYNQSHCVIDFEWWILGYAKSIQ